MADFIHSTWLSTETCCNCGMLFAMPQDVQKRLRDKPGTSFYCPAGHSQHYIGKSEAQKLREELERQREKTENANARAARIEQERAATAKAHRKMRTRIVNGVCPCCNRTFQNVLRHMQTQHPEFAGQQTIAAIRQLFGMSQRQVADEAGVTTAHVSQYERGTSVVGYARDALDRWLNEHSPRGVVADAEEPQP